MRNALRSRLAVRLAATALLLMPMTVQGSEGGLPAGKGQQVMISACTSCHGLSNILNPHKPLSAEEWEYYLYDMVARGAPVRQEDLQELRRYLVENFANADPSRTGPGER